MAEPKNSFVPSLSLFTKLSAAFVLVVVVAVGVVAWGSRQSAEREFTSFVRQSQAERPEELLAQLAAHYAERGSWSGVEPLLERFRADPGARPRRPPLLLVDAQGRIVATNWMRNVNGQLLDPALMRGWPIQVNGETVGTLLMPGGGGVMFDAVRGMISPEGAETIERIRQAILVAGLVASGVALLLAGLLAWGLVRPLHRLTRAAEAIAQGDLSQRVPVTSGDEVGELANAFNTMAGELQRAEQVRRNMTADVAHELRNPLSVVRSHVEALQDGVFELTPENLDPIHDKVLLLGRLVEDLRELALAEAGQLPLERAPTDLRTLVVETVQGLQAQADKKGVALRADLPAELPLVWADRGRIGQVLTNLLSNALRHTPAAGEVSVSASADADWAYLSVADTGQGIAPQDLPYVFERFYRGDRARERPVDGQGTGLGLAIARGIVRAHGGEIEVSSQVGEGSCFRLRLPLGRGR